MRKPNFDPADFHLLGHDSPYGSYPAPAIPVGSLGKTPLACIYPAGASGPVAQAIDSGADYAGRGQAVPAHLRGFNCLTERLFAFGPNDIERYSAAEEWRFLAGLFNNPKFASADPFVRLMLARHSRQRSIIERQIEACHDKLRKTNPSSADEWRNREIAEMPDQVFVALSPDMFQSPVTSSVVRAILATPNLGPSFQAAEEAGVASRIRSARVFVAIRDGAASNDSAKGIYYQMGIAAATEKPVLLIGKGFDDVPVEVRSRAKLIDPVTPSVVPLEQRVASELATLLAIARPAEHLLSDLYWFADGVRLEGKTLLESVNTAFQIASGRPGAPPPEEFPAAWDECRVKHQAWMASYLNGASRQAVDSLHHLLGAANGDRPKYSSLESDFGRLQTHLKLYSDAYETASNRVAQAKPGPERFALIDPVDDSLKTAIAAAATVADSVVSIMLPPVSGGAGLRDA